MPTKLLTLCNPKKINFLRLLQVYLDFSSKIKNILNLHLLLLKKQHIRIETIELFLNHLKKSMINSQKLAIQIELQTSNKIQKIKLGLQ